MPASGDRLELRIWSPETDLEVNPNFEIEATPKVTIPTENLEKAKTAERIQEPIDSATFVVNSPYGDYSDRIEPGDRIELWGTSREGSVYGSGDYNAGTFGSSAVRRWTGIVRGLTYEVESPTNTQITIDAEDYVFGIMNMRIVYDAFEQTPIAGSADAVVDQILEERAPEIGRQGVDAIPELTDIYIDGRGLLDVMTDLARRADAVIWSDGRHFHMHKAADFAASRSVSPGDIGTHALRVNDDHIVNDLRVDGGTDYAVDQEQLDRTATARVTESNRAMVPITARKSSYDRIEVWTRKDQVSEDSVMVRLQNDRNGAPVDVDDIESDIASQQLPHHFISHDDFTTFLMPQHALPPGEQVWLIVQATGPTGHEIGTNFNGQPAFRAHFPYPLDVKIENRESQRVHRVRQDREKRSNISSFRAARDYGEGILDHATEPRRELAFETRADVSINDPEAMNLGIGDVFTANFPWETAEGNYIVAERNDQWEAANLTTTYVAREVASL